MVNQTLVDKSNYKKDDNLYAKYVPNLHQNNQGGLNSNVNSGNQFNNCKVHYNVFNIDSKFDGYMNNHSGREKFDKTSKYDMKVYNMNTSNNMNDFLLKKQKSKSSDKRKFDMTHLKKRDQDYINMNLSGVYSLETAKNYTEKR